MVERIDIVFHFGAHKTATSHLQNIFVRNASVFGKAEVRFVGPTFLRQDGMRLTHLLGTHLDTSERDRQLRLLAGPRRRIILSEENFVGGLCDDFGLPKPQTYGLSLKRLSALAKGLQPHRLHLALGIRDYASFWAAVYGQVLMGGKTPTWNAFAEALENVRFRWHSYIGELASSGVFSSILLWRQEEYAALCPEIVNALCGMRLSGLDYDAQSRVNEGLSKDAVELVFSELRFGRQPAPVLQLREKLSKSKGYAAFQPWSQSMLTKSQQAYRADSEAMKNHSALTFLTRKQVNA